MNFQGCCFCSWLLCINSVYATEPFAYQTENGIDIVPTLMINAGYNDNVQRTQNQELSSSALTISPKIIGFFETQRGFYQLSYQLDAINYNKSHADNVVDHQLYASSLWAFTPQHRLQLKFQHQITHEPRGTGLTKGISLAVDKPLRYHYQDLSARYTYGSKGAQGRIVTVGGFESKQYHNVFYSRANQIEQSHYYNWQQPYVGAEFYYVLSGNFHAVTTARFEDRRYQYTDPTPGYTRDSQNTLLYGGLEWDVSGKTQGTLLLGIQDKDFADSHREDVQSFSWKANINWSPTQYAQFTLEGLQALHDPDIQGDYVKDNAIKLDWEHHWTPLFHTISTVSYGTNDYPGNDRKDDDRELSVGLIHSVTRWLDLSLNTSWYQRNSTLVGFEYQQTLFFFGMEMSL